MVANKSTGSVYREIANKSTRETVGEIMVANKSMRLCTGKLGETDREEGKTLIQTGNRIPQTSQRASCALANTH